ncbi:MAG: hypothetical protein ABIS51_18425 [Sphingomonas sp.]
MRGRISPAEAEWRSQPVVGETKRRRPMNAADIACVALALLIPAALALAF